MALCFQTALAVHRPRPQLSSSQCRPARPASQRRAARKVSRAAPRLCAGGGEQAAPQAEEPSSRGLAAADEGARPDGGPFAWLRRLIARRRQLRAGGLRDYGVAALLSYGLFDALTYSVSFLLSLRAYVAAGKTLTWGTLPQVLALMWGINNLSRPFRIAGALALAPLVDRRVVKPFAAFVARLRGKR